MNNQMINVVKVLSKAFCQLLARGTIFFIQPVWLTLNSNLATKPIFSDFRQIFWLGELSRGKSANLIPWLTTQGQSSNCFATAM